MIQLISAVTLAVRDMARSVEFYQKLGFELLHGGEAFVNLGQVGSGRANVVERARIGSNRANSSKCLSINGVFLRIFNSDKS